MGGGLLEAGTLSSNTRSALDRGSLALDPCSTASRLATVILETRGGVSGGTLKSAAASFAAEEPARVKQWLAGQDILVPGPARGWADAAASLEQRFVALAVWRIGSKPM